MTKIILTRGDTLAEDYALTDDAGAVYDLTNCTLRFTLRRQFGSDTALIEYESGTDAELAITDAANGLAELRVPAAATAALPIVVPLRWDVEVEAADGTISTPERGTMTVRPDATR